MKTFLKFLVGMIVFFIWVDTLGLCFEFMNQSNSISFSVGLLGLVSLTIGPVIIFSDEIKMFLKNMYGVFFGDKNKEE